MQITFSTELSALVFPDNTHVNVPWEITAQAEPGQTTATVERWARKAGLASKADKILAVPAALAA
jgi:hypothetical protein